MTKRLLIVPLLLLVCCPAFLDAQEHTAPDFTLTDVDGNTTSLNAELASGRAVMLDFFSSQCHVCKEAAVHINQIQDDYRSVLSVWKINRFTDAREDAQFIKNFENWYNSQVRAFTNGQDLFYYYADLLGIPRGTPIYVLVMPDKTIAWGQLGFRDETLRNRLNSAGLTPNSVGAAVEVLEEFRLSPNPADAKTSLQFTVKHSAVLDISITDLSGKVLARIFSGYLNAGERRSISLDVDSYPAGTYFLHFSSKQGVRSEPLLIRQ